MNLIETILALLEAQFQGVRKDGLTQLARSLALTVDTEEKATEVVGKLTADNVKKFVSDWRKDADAEISKANKTYEDGLKSKYDFVDKNGAEPPQPKPQPSGLTREDVQSIVTEAVKAATQGLQSEVTNLKGSAISASRRELLVNAIGKEVPASFRNAILDGFENRAFADENAFNEFLDKTKGDVATFTQELADKGLSLHEKPVFGSPNKDGVSEGVQSYIATQAKQGENLGGKEV